MKKRLLCLALALSFCLGLLPAPVLAALAPPYESGEKELIFNYVTMSGAGAAQMDDWAMGEYMSVQEALSAEGGGDGRMSAGFLKTRVMIRAMHFNAWDYEEPIAFYVPANSAGSSHELTLYGYEDVDPADISLSGVRLTGQVERRVFGDVNGEGTDGRLYWYTLPVFVPANDVDMQVLVKGELYATLPVCHVRGESPVSLYATMQVYDYEEGDEPDTLRSMTLRVSGFSLPSDPLGYTYRWMADPEEDQWASVDASNVTPEDEFGYRYVTFDFFDEDTPSEDMIWGSLLFDNDYSAFFFGKENHLVNVGTETAPVYAFRTDYAYDDEPYFHLGGCNAEVPSPYYCIFKDPTDAGKDPETMPELVVLGTRLPDGSVSTQLPYVRVYQEPGSYLGGEWRLSTDGRSWHEWNYAGDRHSQTEMTFAEGKEYGGYTIFAQFRKEGLKTVTVRQKVTYHDGTAPAPAKSGILDKATNAAVPMRGKTAVVKSIEGASYLFYAQAPEGLTVSYDFNGCAESHRGDLSWNAAAGRYETVLRAEEIPPEASSFVVWSSGDGLVYTKDSAILELPISVVEGGFLRPLYDPTVSYEVKKDESGNAYYAVAPGAGITGVFEAAGGEGRVQQIRLEYRTAAGGLRTVTAAAASEGNNQYRATVILPEDADRLGKLSYELLEDGETAAGRDYDLSNYRVYARTSLTGVPADYIGAAFTLKGPGVDKHLVLTGENHASLPMGDLPTGSYTYEISGKSGHICGGTVAVTRGQDAALPGPFPALGSISLSTAGFTSSLNGREVNPAGQVRLDLTAPDGKKLALTGAAGSKLEQVPVGTSGTASLTWDTTVSDEISACVPASQSVTVSGDEALSFTYKPFTFRTVSGNVWAVKTYPSGATYGLVPRPTQIILTQEVNRGGKTETVTFTAAPDYSFDRNPRGQWSALCYDDIPVKIEFRCFTWDTLTVNVTESGNVRLGTNLMTYGSEMLIRLDAQVKSPTTLKEDGTPYFGASDSTTVPVDSGFLGVSAVWIGSKGSFDTSSGLFETYTQNGQTYLKLHEGFVDAGETISICAGGTLDYGGSSITVPYTASNGARNYVPVRTDEDGNPYAVLTATYGEGGQFRATVVDDNDSEYVGFLAYPTGSNTCLFAYGRGELTLPYGRYQAGGSGAILAFMVKEADAEAMAALLGSSPGRLWNLLPKDKGWSTLFFEKEYGGRLLYRTVNAYGNATVYLEDLQPDKPMITGVLDPYSFTYHYELTDSPSTIRLVGTLTKRYPDQTGQDVIRSMTLYTMEDRNQGSPLNATVTFTQEDLGNGQTLITAEMPMSYDLRARFRLNLTYWHSSWTEDEGEHTLDFEYSEPLKIFSLANPGDVYIVDQLDAQGLTSATPEAQATWYLNTALRVFISDKPEENQVTIYDNGTPVYSYDVGSGMRNSWGTGGWMYKFRVRLTDNLQPGIHVMWANRILDGETISTEPVVFTLAAGRQNNSVHISNLYWYHWNHRLNWDENDPDKLYFDNLSDLAGENIWIWPSKRHQMRFTVKNATSDELKGVNLVFQSYWSQGNTSLYDRDPQKYGSFRSSVFSGIQGYNTVTRAIPCRLISENKIGNYSVWGIDEFYMGYLQSFEFEFDYLPAIEEELNSMTAEELSVLEADAFYTANGLGEVPDDLEQVETIQAMSGDQLTQTIADMSEASQALSDLDLKITEDSAKRMKMELQTPTKELSAYTVTMEKGGTMQLPEILKLMEKERTSGNQNPKEKGWDVTWGEYETAQGKTLLRIASFDGVEKSTGRHALLTHTTYYVTKSVADALEGGTLAEASLAAGEDPGTPDHWTKQLYDGTSAVYSASDLTDEAWKAYCKSRYLKLNPGDLDGAAKFANSESLIPKKLDGTMKVLGVADTIITYAKGPSGADPNGLRELLRNVHDEKARRSLEMQIRDYESLRYDIYKQDCAMSTYSTASNFSPMGPIGKVVVFVGGLANGVISGWSKDYNRQVYNTTLHDIQLQIKYEALKQERLKKSFIDAEKWLRDKMDKIYGKGNWSEYALAEERKNWVLKEYPGGILRYVWKDKAPEFSVTQDPSGYVYEAVTEDTVQGVTASLYYSETEDGSYALWTDPFGEQPNPQGTSDTGNYMWMVPIGWWKVRYEKDGYLAAESKAMPVPPVHTTVNIGLLSAEAPTVRVVPGEGQITVLFSKYMQLESLIRLFGGDSYEADSFDASAFTVQFYGADGLSIPGTVTFPDLRENTGYKGEGYGTDVIDSDWFARYAVFTPEDPAADLSGVTWKLAEGMVSYAGVPLEGETAALHVLRLDPNGGMLDRRTAVTDENGRVSMLPAPYRDGCNFLGWFTAAEGGTRKTAEDAFTADLTLYAHWETTGGGVPAPASGLSILGSKETAKTGKASVRLENRGGTAAAAVLLGACYDGEGRMLSVSRQAGTLEPGEHSFTLSLPALSKAVMVKYFLLSDDGTNTPLAAPVEKKGPGSD